MKLEDIILSEEKIKEKGYIIKNNIIERVNIIVVGHYNNCVSLSIQGNNIRIFGGFNNNKNLGLLLRAFVEFFEISEENGLLINSIYNIPCRIILTEEYGRCVGFGHFIKNKFILRKDFNEIDDISG